MPDRVGSPPTELPTIAHTAAGIFGGTPRVRRYFNDDESLSVEILDCAASPEAGLTSYATIGLSVFDNDLVVEGRALRVELVMTAKDDCTVVANGLSSCAFAVGHGDHQIRPRVVFPDVFSGYGEPVTTPHALLWFPFVWEQQFEPIVSEAQQIEWLMVIPITVDEFVFVAEHGADRLIDQLEAVEVDIFDLSRGSAIARATAGL